MTYKCNICNTEYKSYKSAWRHKNTFHKNDNCILNNDDAKERKYKCATCNKKFTTNHGLKYHNEKVCKVKPTDTQELKNEIIELKKQVNTLQTKTNKITTNNSHNTNNGTINNVKNIIYINKTGTENVLELNEKELNEIFSKELTGIITLVKLINFNEPDKSLIVI
jgi:DNA-directed RNA polymerase subunit RPC12/RpoP